MRIPPERFTDLNGIALRAPLGSFEAEFLNWGFFKPVWWRNYMHAHTFFEICYAYAGSGVFRILGKEYRVGAGDVFIAKPREEHEIVSSRKDPMGIYFWSYTLAPQKSAAKQGDPAREPIDRLLHHFIESRQPVSRRVPGMKRTLELMTEEIVRREPGYTGLLHGLVGKLALDTARAVDAPKEGESAAPRVVEGRLGEERLAALAQRYMRDNLARSLSIRDIAAQTGLSVRHFTRVFTLRTGRAPLEALTQFRMEAAAQWLLDRDLSVKEVALRAGYPDVRYFTTVFHRHQGLPPAAYRERGGTTFKSKVDSKKPQGPRT